MPKREARYIALYDAGVEVRTDDKAECPFSSYGFQETLEITGETIRELSEMFNYPSNRDMDDWTFVIQKRLHSPKQASNLVKIMAEVVDSGRIEIDMIYRDKGKDMAQSMTYCGRFMVEWAYE